MAGLASLLLIEAVSKFPGNESFQRNVEYTVLVHQFFGRRWYYLFFFILYGSIQSVNIASIVGSAQNFDSLFVQLLGGTCGYGLSPKSGLMCVNTLSNENSPFGDNYMLITFGYMIVMAIVFPLTSIDLNDNVILQLFSLFYNFLFLAVELVFVILEVVARNSNPFLLPISFPPAVGKSQLDVIGNVLFNFTNTVPSWFNTKHPRVSAQKSIWYCCIIAFFLYVGIGLIGAVGYPGLSKQTNLLQAMLTSPNLTPAGKGVVTFIYLLFPILTYITSIPVAMIILKLNFMAAKICGEGWAQFYSTFLPFILGVPMQTGSIIAYFGTYTSVIFQSTCNFICPFMIYLFLDKRNMVMAQSVLDELEFLDISAGVKKSKGMDDDFDYIYHLPHADPLRIVFRDPLKLNQISINKASSIGQLSQISKHSVKQLRAMLDPSLTAKRRNTSRSHQHRKSIVPPSLHAGSSMYGIKNSATAEENIPFGSMASLSPGAAQIYGSKLSLTPSKMSKHEMVADMYRTQTQTKKFNLSGSFHGDLDDESSDNRSAQQIIPIQLSTFRAIPPGYIFSTKTITAVSMAIVTCGVIQVVVNIFTR